MTIQISATVALKLLSLSDAPALLKVVNDSRQRLHRYLNWVEQVTDLASTEQYIKQRISSNLYNACWYGIYINDQLLGVFGIKYANTQTNIAEIGYWLGDGAAGQGIVSLIITTIRPQLHAQFGTQTLEFKILEENMASIRIAQKAGAQFIESRPYETVTSFSKQRLLIYHAPI